MPARKPYQFHPEAWLEFEAAADWYDQRSSDASIRFLSAIYEALEDVANWPRSWPVFNYGTRRFILRHFPFSIIYQEATDTVNVIAVAHSKRKPGYWKGRITSSTEDF